MAQDVRFIPIILLFFFIFSCTLFPFRILFQKRIKLGHQQCFLHVKSQPVLLLKHKAKHVTNMLNYKLPFSKIAHEKSKHVKTTSNTNKLTKHSLNSSNKKLFEQYSSAKSNVTQRNEENRQQDPSGG